MAKGKNEYYIQCVMRREVKKGCVMTTSWIPEKYAVEGKYLQLKNKVTGEWEDGWRVVNKCTKEDKKTAELNERNFTKHRYATDIFTRNKIWTE